jgi:Zn-dependent alcohol dehydrogenase
VVKQRSVVSLRGLVDDDEELKLLAPLGCGIQTGTGAFVNTAQVEAGQDVAVLGVGSVGLSAIMVTLTSTSFFFTIITFRAILNKLFIRPHAS